MDTRPKNKAAQALAALRRGSTPARREAALKAARVRSERARERREQADKNRSL